MNGSNFFSTEINIKSDSIPPTINVKGINFDKCSPRKNIFKNSNFDEFDLFPIDYDKIK